MKKCINCGNIADNNINYCSYCGSNVFIPMDQENDNKVENMNSSYYVNQPHKKKKMVITSLSIGSIIALIITMGIKYGCREYLKQQNGKTEYHMSDDAMSDVNLYLQKFNYTKGNITDGIYSNSWADIEFAIPENFPEVEDIEKYDNEITETGYASYDESVGRFFFLEFHNYQEVNEPFDEQKFLDYTFEDIKETLINKDIDLSDFVISEDYKTKIAGDEYFTRDIKNRETGFIQRYCILIKDKIIIEFAIACEDESEADELLNSIKTADD